MASTTSIRTIAENTSARENSLLKKEVAILREAVDEYTAKAEHAEAVLHNPEARLIRSDGASMEILREEARRAASRSARIISETVEDKIIARPLRAAIDHYRAVTNSEILFSLDYSTSVAAIAAADVVAATKAMLHVLDSTDHS